MSLGYRMVIENFHSCQAILIGSHNEEQPIQVSSFNSVVLTLGCLLEFCGAFKTISNLVPFAEIPL